MPQKPATDAMVVDDTNRPWRLGVLISGSGRTLENLLGAIERAELDAEIVCVMSSRERVRGVEIASAAGIPVSIVSRKLYPDACQRSRAIYDTAERHRADLLVLAGYLQQMTVADAWKGRMLNIHPALLPQAETYAAGHGLFGDRVHAAVLAHGDIVSGATVHIVTDEYDSGPPVLQQEVPVKPDDVPASLGARVFAAECELYPEAIRQYMAAHPELKR